MSTFTTERITEIVIGKATDWIKPFHVSDYLQNQPLIEKLYEEKQLALVKVDDLEKKLKEMEVELSTLKLNNLKLRMELAESTRKSRYSFLLSLLAVVSIGIGVNVATANPSTWTGWFIIIISCAIEFVAFLLKPENPNN